MDKINFGTDGWWGIIAKDFTLANVSKVGYAIARWMTNKFKESSVVLGYDTRFGGDMFMEAVAKILASKGIQVYISESFVTAPMVSLAVVKLKAQCGVMVTASHNPANYNGIKLKGEHGGPMLKADLSDIQNLISSDYDFDLEMLNWNYLLERGKIQYINLEAVYLKELQDNFKLNELTNSPLRLAFDSMYGGAQMLMKKALPNALHLHDEVNPAFANVPPDPIYRNLHELAEHIVQFKDIDAAFAVDADGDRLAFFDHEGNYVSSHKIFLLVVHVLVKYLNRTGKVLAGVTISARLEKLCAHYGLDVDRVPIGFNHITEIMLQDDILAGGQETGGIALGSYLPERDAVWIGIQICEWLLETGKSLAELLHEVEEITGTFAFDKTELHYNRNERNKILDKCKNKLYTEFGSYLVTRVTDLDGYKFHFSETEWAFIRPSSLRPILRLYIEADDENRVRDIMRAVITKLNEQ